MPSRRGLKERISRALLLQAAAIAVAAVVGVYVAGLVLKELLITQALRQEAEFFWHKHESDADFPMPDTLNLTGYMSGAQAGYQPSESMLGLEPGFHVLPESTDFGTVTVNRADVCATLGVVPSDVSGLGTHVHVNTVRFVQQAVFDDHRCTVGNQTVTLHLAKSKTTLSGTTLGWLSCEDLDASA